MTTVTPYTAIFYLLFIYNISAATPFILAYLTLFWLRFISFHFIAERFSKL